MKNLLMKGPFVAVEVALKKVNSILLILFLLCLTDIFWEFIIYISLNLAFI